MRTGPLALLQIGVVAAAVEVDLLLRQVEFEDLGDGPGQELAVVADHDGARAQALHEPLQALQTLQVQVVGRLVEQEDVVAGEQQRGEARAGRLATGQRGHRQVQAHGQPELVGDLLGPLVEVGAAEVQPLVQGRRVRVIGARGPVDQALGRRVQRRLGAGDARTPGQEVPYRLLGAPLRLLGQMADGSGGRGEPQLTGLGRVQAGEQAQQGGLPGAVDADEADDVAGGDDEVEIGEERALTVRGGEVLGDEGCSHGPTILSGLLRAAGPWP